MVTVLLLVTMRHTSRVNCAVRSYHSTHGKLRTTRLKSAVRKTFILTVRSA